VEELPVPLELVVERTDLLDLDCRDTSSSLYYHSKALGQLAWDEGRSLACKTSGGVGDAVGFETIRVDRLSTYRFIASLSDNSLGPVLPFAD
jgi:hypothetical protein